MLRLKIFGLSSLFSLVFSFSLRKKEGSSFLSHLEMQYSVDQQCYAISGLSTSTRAVMLTHLAGNCLVLVQRGTGNKNELKFLSLWELKIQKSLNGINSWHERNKTAI